MPETEPRLFINSKRTDRRNPKPQRVTLSTITPAGRLVERASLTRDEAIGAAALLLECALRLPKDTVTS